MTSFHEQVLPATTISVWKNSSVITGLWYCYLCTLFCHLVHRQVTMHCIHIHTYTYKQTCASTHVCTHANTHAHTHRHIHQGMSLCLRLKELMVAVYCSRFLFCQWCFHHTMTSTAKMRGALTQVGAWKKWQGPCCLLVISVNWHETLCIFCISGTKNAYSIT